MHDEFCLECRHDRKAASSHRYVSWCCDMGIRLRWCGGRELVAKRLFWREVAEEWQWMRKGGLRDRDQDHKVVRQGRISFNNDVVPDRQSRSTLLSPSSYTLTDLLPLNDSFQIGVRRLESCTMFVYLSAFSSSNDIVSVPPLSQIYYIF